MKIQVRNLSNKGSHPSEWRYQVGLPRGTTKVEFGQALLNLAGETIEPWPGDKVVVGSVVHKGELKCEYAFVMSYDQGRRSWFQRQWLDHDQFIVVSR